VVRKNLHPYLIYSLLEAMTQVHHDPTFLSNAGDYPTIAGSQLNVHPIAAQYYRTGTPATYHELAPWLASAIAEYQFVIAGLFFLIGIFIAGRYLIEMGSLVLASIALAILRGVERSMARTAEASRRQLRLVKFARRLLQLTLRGREQLAARSDSP
jgi:hypothetical protein